MYMCNCDFIILVHVHVHLYTYNVVDPSTGEISSSLLADWNEAYSLASLLLSVQVCVCMK